LRVVEAQSAISALFDRLFNLVDESYGEIADESNGSSPFEEETKNLCVEVLNRHLCSKFHVLSIVKLCLYPSVKWHQ
jgi:hypothetical protein